MVALDLWKRAGTGAAPDAVPAVVIIGAGPYATIRVHDPYVSDEHARLTRGHGVHIQDLGSTNGTYVNGVRVPVGYRWRLRRGDVLRIGQTEIRW